MLPKKDVAAKMDLLWKFLKPISFALIGKEVNFAKLDGTTVAYGVVIIIVGSVVSSIVFLRCLTARMFCHRIDEICSFLHKIELKNLKVFFLLGV